MIEMVAIMRKDILTSLVNFASITSTHLILEGHNIYNRINVHSIEYINPMITSPFWIIETTEKLFPKDSNQTQWGEEYD